MNLPNLHTGSRSPDVGNWQRFLNTQGFRGHNGADLSVDEIFGQHSAFATMSWQRGHGLLESGVVAMVERKLAQAEGYIPFVPARNFTPATRAKIDVLVVHDMEYPESPTRSAAEWCAEFFADPNAPKASAHFTVDDCQVIQCVRERDVAWHAPGVNRSGIGIEHAGYARQSRAEWLDDYSQRELQISAKLAAQLCTRWQIPIVKLSAANLQDGRRGICGHVDATHAFSNGKGHTDPGPNFPWTEYVAWVQAAADAL